MARPGFDTQPGHFQINIVIDPYPPPPQDFKLTKERGFLQPHMFVPSYDQQEYSNKNDNDEAFNIALHLYTHTHAVRVSYEHR